MELRGEILGEVAVRVGSAEARMELLETKIHGDLKRNCMMRIDKLEDEVKRNSKVVSELEERTTAVDSIEAIERDIRGALQDEDAKRGGKRSVSPKLSLVRSGSSNTRVPRVHTSPGPVIVHPVDSSAADPRSERSNSTADADGRGSVRLASPEHSNSSYRSLSASQSALSHIWQPPLAPTGESSLADEEIENTQ